MENGNYWSETEDRAASVAEGPGPDRDDPMAIGRYRVIRRLGQGGFGRVYLARDDDLDRSVAIKVPNPERIAGPGDVEAYLAEARALAKLDHPHIVPVFDVGRTADGLCFVVSKYIDGSDLADRNAQGRPSNREAAELVATIAEALHHAHTRGLVHRDVKPANILIDAARSPWVADFGLALKDEDYGKGARLAGTPSYMSPEQARGEGHRVDGRSDLFSLGVVLYELLTGRKPFRGDTRSEVMDQIATADPRPPRQIDDALSRELERICLKALSKRASERYSTGRDMAEDLRHFVRTEAASAPSPAPPSAATAPASTAAAPTPGSTREATPVTPVPVRSDSDGRAVKIVPKGLRSFDRHDASFFLELLPGPRDRDGLPEGLRFWKTRIETTDPDATFKVGLIYGPSGCGKSSMVKAGLLPRLHPDVLPVYVEATPEETEARLLRGLRKVCPELDAGMDLVETLAALRRGRVLRSGQKVLLVLDQFEQWLFARRAEADPELVAALRQCDGANVQAIVMVRDDFWMAATRFMRDLEVRIVEGENSAAVDLFDLLHARRVLAAFGRAYGVLPEKPSEMTADQKAFLEQSVAGLANEGKVISVRLALFAEMVKGKPWTTATLRDVGGARGIGVTFLDETFSAATAPPEHRLHQRAAQAVLKSLLPGTGADIKGQMRSEAELREVSGYAARPRDFEDLICILDRELRLISPTDPEGSVNESQSGGECAGHRFYQLTHDYLVPSLREWLTRKQRETRRGRAEIRLAERAAIWEARPENRHLPSVAEWLNIRALSRPKDWTEPQRKMMRRAGRAHGLRAFAAAIGVIGLAVAGLEVWNRVAAARLVRRVLLADTAQVPAMIRDAATYRRWTEPEFRATVADTSGDPRARLHASLALLPLDPGQLSYLQDRLLNGPAGGFVVLRDALRSHGKALAPKMWSALEAAGPSDPGVLPAAAALALYDPGDPRWSAHGDKVARALVAVSPSDFGSWVEALRPVLPSLTGSLTAIIRDGGRPETEHALAANILADAARDDPGLLADLLVASDRTTYASVLPIARQRADDVAPRLQAVLERDDDRSRESPQPHPSWKEPDRSLVTAIESARGMIPGRGRWAFCQAMPLAEFVTLAEGLRASGYRPVRFRPYADGPAPKVAAVWARDREDWRIESGLSAEEMRRRNEKYRAEKFIPLDVAGYLTNDREGKVVERYTAIWVKTDGGDDSRMCVGATPDDERARQDEFKDQEWFPRTLQVLHLADGSPRISGVWGPLTTPRATTASERDLTEEGLAAALARRSDASPVDVSVEESVRSRPWREQVRIVRDLAEAALRRKRGNPELTRSKAVASLRLGEPEKALEDLNFLIGSGRDDSELFLDRAIAQARLGREKEAGEDLARFRRSYTSEASKLAAAAIVAAELGEEVEGPIRALDAAIGRRPTDVEVRREAARALASASGAIASRDRTAGRAIAERAIRLLEELSRDGDVEAGSLDNDPALDPVRDDPRFVEIAKARHPGRRYAAVWVNNPDFEARTIAGLAPPDQLEEARKLLEKGFHPVAWSAATATTGGSLATASVWHAPAVSEQELDRRAERKARAAVALVCLGKGSVAWPLLQHSPDPRLRSFILNGLKTLGADPKAIADAFRHVEHAASGPSPGSDADTIFFDRETSIRRSLILALGTYGPDELPVGERDALAGELRGLYRSDPDAGIHAAAEWTLRRWGVKPEPLAADRMGPDDRGSRRWFVNGHGQTFAVIEGPVGFRMGSPGTEPDRSPRNAEEAPRRMSIPRTFAIATREVTVEQFQEFAKTHNQFETDAFYLRKNTSAPVGPWIAPIWYAAAAYCNWLSRQEHISEDQWCYLPNEAGEYGEGMRIPADATERTGYRLPTEAEWEYACRAGAATSRHYGVSDGLLGAYAHYSANSEEHAWPAGSLLPNDLGLFDMLGNVSEWCQDREGAFRPSRRGLFLDLADIDEVVTDKHNRVLRGGSFVISKGDVRSAVHTSDTPSLQNTTFGFRLARTLKPGKP